MTTLSGLSTSANQALRRLLNGKDLADVAGKSFSLRSLTSPVEEKQVEVGRQACGVGIAG